MLVGNAVAYFAKDADKKFDNIVDRPRSKFKKGKIYPSETQSRLRSRLRKFCHF